jgi:hypothetical protein
MPAPQAVNHPATGINPLVAFGYRRRGRESGGDCSVSSLRTLARGRALGTARGDWGRHRPGGKEGGPGLQNALRRCVGAGARRGARRGFGRGRLAGILAHAAGASPAPATAFGKAGALSGGCRPRPNGRFVGGTNKQRPARTSGRSRLPSGTCEVLLGKQDLQAGILTFWQVVANKTRHSIPSEVLDGLEVHPTSAAARTC